MAFRRALGPFDATMVVVGGIIGSGIFINPAFVAARLNSFSLILIVWALGGAVALTGAFIWAELGARFPRAGGALPAARLGEAIVTTSSLTKSYGLAGPSSTQTSHARVRSSSHARTWCARSATGR